MFVLLDQVIVIFYPLFVDNRLGLIRARILGGNSAAGDLIAFLDAHCRVNSKWLDSPYRLIMEVGMSSSL